MNELVRSLTLHRLRFLALGVQDGELELGLHFALAARDEKQIERQVVLALLIESFRVDPQAPFELVVGAGRERRALERLADLFAAKREVVDRPHVAELDHFDLGEAPVLGDHRLRHVNLLEKDGTYGPIGDVDHPNWHIGVGQDIVATTVASAATAGAVGSGTVQADIEASDQVSTSCRVGVVLNRIGGRRSRACRRATAAAGTGANDIAAIASIAVVVEQSALAHSSSLISGLWDFKIDFQQSRLLLF